MDHFTMPIVAGRFEDALRVLKRLPADKLKGFCSHWPAIIRTADELKAMEKRPLRLPPPSPRSISDMDQALRWLFLLECEEERRLIWLRAARVPWKIICRQLGICRTTAYYKWRVAILTIVIRLNNEKKENKYV